MISTIIIYGLFTLSLVFLCGGMYNYGYTQGIEWVMKNFEEILQERLNKILNGGSDGTTGVSDKNSDG